MKKIVFVVPSLRGGGAERVISYLCNNLDPLKFQIILCLLKKEGQFLAELHPNVEIVDFDVKHARNCIFQLVKLVRSEKPDIVMSTLGHLNAIVASLKPLFKKGTILIGREANVLSEISKKEPYILRLFYKLFYKNFDCIIAQSDDMKNDLIQNFNFPTRKIEKINNPVNINFIQEKLMSKDIISLKPNKINLVSVGRLSYQKGYDLLLKTMSEMVNIRKYHLTIIGDGELREKLKGLSIKLGIEESVSFLGFQINPYKYLEIADIFISSSRHEGFPNAVLESLACGTPVVANNYKGGISEIIREGFNGSIIDITRSRDFEESIIKSTNLNSVQIKEDVVNRFQLRNIVQQYEKCFLKLL